MNKGLKIILITLVVLAAAGGAAYLAFGRAGDAYLSMIPTDAKGIAKVDLRAIIKDSGMTSGQQQALLQRLSGDDDMDASGIGVDLTKPLFGFVSQSGYFAIAAKVNDEDNLVKALNASNGKGQHADIRRQRGYSWAVLKGNYLIAFNDDKLLCMGPAVGVAQDQLRNEMYRYLEQDKEESAIDTESFNYVSSSQAPGAAFLTMSLVPESFRKTVSDYIPASMANELAVALTLNLGKHNLTLASELLTNNDEAKTKLQTFESLFRTIDGRLVDSCNENAFAWWCVNVDGAQLLERLRAIPSLRLALIGVNMLVDFDQMIRSIDGDVAADFAVAQDARGKAELQSRLKAQMKNTDFLKNADYWVKSNRSNLVQALSAKDFRLNMNGSPIWFGVDDNILYITSSEGMRYSKGNTSITAQESAIKGTRFYATLDLTKAGNYLDDVKPYTDICRSVTFSMQDLGAFTLKAEGAQDKNLLFDLLMN